MMYYIYDKTTREVRGATSNLVNLNIFKNNWTNVDVIESTNSISKRYSGRWIVNEQNELENIID